MAQYGPFLASDYAIGTKLSDVSGFTPGHGATSTDDIEVEEATVGGVTFRYWRPVGASGDRIYTYDTAGDVGDMEMLCQFYIPDGHRDSVFAIAHSDTPDSNTYYRFGMRDRDAVIERWVDGSFTSLANSSTLLLSGDVGKYAFVRCRRDGTNLRVRLFGVSDDYDAINAFPSEPASWSEETTDSGISAAGTVGVGWRSDDGMGVRWVSFGTDGDPAPTAEGTLDGTVTITDVEIDSSTAVNVEWSYNQTNEAGFEARVDEGPVQDLGDPDPKLARVIGLDPSTTYNSPGLQLRAYSAGGETTEWSAAETFTTPAAATPTFARTNQTIMVQTQISGETVSAGGGTRYLPMAASYETGTNPTSTRKPITDELVVSKPRLVVTANTLTEDATLVLVDDDTDTDVVITVPAGQAGTFTDDVNTHQFSGTTEGYWKLPPLAGSGSFTAGIFVYEFKPTDEDAILSWIGPLSSGEAAFTSVETQYILPIGTRNPIATESDAELRMLFPGTLRDLRVAGGADNYDGDATLGFRVDGVDTSVTTPFTNDGLSSDFAVSNLVDTAVVSPGSDYVLFARPDAGATGSTRDVKWFATLESDNAEVGGQRTGEFLLATGRPGGVVPSSSISYMAIAGEPDTVSTESDAQIALPLDVNLFRFAVRVASTSDGVGVFTLRRNGVDTDLSLEVSGSSSTFEAPIDLVEKFDAGDLVDYRIVQTSGTFRIQYIAIAGAVRAAGEGDSLTAQDLVTPVAVLDQAAITQQHALSASDLDAPVAVLDQAAITQQHALSASDLDAPVAQIDQATLSEESGDSLTAQDLAAPTAIIAQASLQQVHDLTAQNLVAPVAVLDEATISQHHVLESLDLVVPVAVLSQASPVGVTGPAISSTTTGLHAPIDFIWADSDRENRRVRRRRRRKRQ